MPPRQGGGTLSTAHGGRARGRTHNVITAGAFVACVVAITSSAFCVAADGAPTGWVLAQPRESCEATCGSDNCLASAIGTITTESEMALAVEAAGEHCAEHAVTDKVPTPYIRSMGSHEKCYRPSNVAVCFDPATTDNAKKLDHDKV